jgi:nitrite reductase/ring-hydroxylating ferredoxin subunit
MDKMNRIVVCLADDLLPGQRKVVDLNGYPISVFNVEERLYAIQDSCPHMGASLSCGNIAGTMMPSNPHQYLYGYENEIIRCPLHNWEFSLKTGSSLCSPDRIKIKTFHVVQEENLIVVYTKIGASKTKS